MIVKRGRLAVLESNPRVRDTRITKGAAGEAAAAAYLESNGCRILSRNWRCRFGEVDIIGQYTDEIVFVEVRTRSARTLHAFGTPLESITAKKRQTLSRCAQAYLVQFGPEGSRRIRFDCIGVILDDSNQPVEINHVVDAF